MPSRSRGIERVSSLLDAASAVFSERGYEGATTTEIAKRARASIGSLYQFFPTKEHIAAALHARHLETLEAMLDTLAERAKGEPVAKAVEELMTELGLYLEANPAFIELGERRSLDPAVKKAARMRLRGRIAAMLQAVEPPLPSERVWPLAALVLHMIRVAGMLRRDDDDAIRQAATEEVQVMLVQHLQAAGAGTGPVPA